MSFVNSSRMGLYPGDAMYSTGAVVDSSKWLKKDRRLDGGYVSDTFLARLRGREGRVVLKTAHGDEACIAAKGSKFACEHSLEREFVLGCYLNRKQATLGHQILAHTLGFFWSASEERDEIKPHLITLLVENSTSARDFLLKNPAHGAEIYYQVLLIAAILDEWGIQHNDLHGRNILVVKNREGRTLNYPVRGKTYRVTPSYRPILIDWGASTLSSDKSRGEVHRIVKGHGLSRFKDIERDASDFRTLRRALARYLEEPSGTLHEYLDRIAASRKKA